MNRAVFWILLVLAIFFCLAGFGALVSEKDMTGSVILFAISSIILAVAILSRGESRKSTTYLPEERYHDELEEFVFYRYKNGKSKLEIIGEIFDSFGPDAAKRASENFDYWIVQEPDNKEYICEPPAMIYSRPNQMQQIPPEPIGLQIAGAILGILFSMPLLLIANFNPLFFLVGFMGIIGGGFGFTKPKAARVLLSIACVMCFFFGPAVIALLLLIPVGLLEAQILRDSRRRKWNNYR